MSFFSRSNQNAKVSSLLEECLRLRQEVRLLLGDDDRHDAGFLEDSMSGVRFSVSAWQLAIAEKLNGQHTWGALRQIIEKSGKLPMSQVDQFVDWLCDNHLMQPVEPPRKYRSKHRKKKRLMAPRNPVGKPKAPSKESSVEKRSWHFDYPQQFAVVVTLAVSVGIFMWKASNVREVAQAPMATPPVEVIQTTMPGHIVKSSTSGVLSDLLVSSGDAVRKGDIIARIENPEDLNRIEELRRQIGECRLRRDQLAKSPDRSAWRGELMHLAALTRELGQHRAEMEIVEMTAPVTGVVVTAESCTRLGSLVEQGDVLMSVVSDLPKDPSIIARN